MAEGHGEEHLRAFKAYLPPVFLEAVVVCDGAVGATPDSPENTQIVVAQDIGAVLL